MARTTWLRLNALIVAVLILSFAGCTSPCGLCQEWLQGGTESLRASGPHGHALDRRRRRPRATGKRRREPVVGGVPGSEPQPTHRLCVAAKPVVARGVLPGAGSQGPTGHCPGRHLPPTAAGRRRLPTLGHQRERRRPPLAISSQFFDQWNFGFNLSWELDFWGRLRRAVTAAERTLDASCANYDDVLVTLLGDVASNYVQVRTLQDRIHLAWENVKLQKEIVRVAERRFKVGSIRAHAVDVPQARSNLAQTEAQIPQLNIELRQACDRLCVLMGIPPTDLDKQLGLGPIPTAPTAVAIGIPADLLRRRPDVRRAEHEALAQGERIGIAEAELYPAFFINGTLGYSAENLPQLFTSDSLTGTIGPGFQWNILNYGRIRNNVRVQDARFQALVAAYQNTVLRANAEVEDGLVAFLRAQERTQSLDTSVSSAKEAVDIGFKEFGAGKVDYNQVALIEQNKVQQEDLQALSHGEIAQGLIRVYRALGGGWQMAPTLVAEVAPIGADAGAASFHGSARGADAA